MATMNLHYLCPGCQRTARLDFDDPAKVAEISCPHCGRNWDVPADSWRDGQVTKCWVCPSGELFVRKDFSQAMGIGIIVVGFAASSVAWWQRQPIVSYGILFATALLDVILYFVVGNLLQCYRCHAQYRGLPGLDQYEPFELETHEKHRQQLARLAQHQTPSQQAAQPPSSD